MFSKIKDIEPFPTLNQVQNLLVGVHKSHVLINNYEYCIQSLAELENLDQPYVIVFDIGDHKNFVVIFHYALCWPWILKD